MHWRCRTRNINKLLSVLVPTISVVILTFTITPRGSRKALWGKFGLKRPGFKVWPAAFALPIVLAGGAYGTALAIGAGRLKDIDLADATPGLGAQPGHRHWWSGPCSS